MAGRQVKVGDRTVNIESFRVYKAMKAGQMISAITEEVPQISDKMAQFTRKYEDENFVQIDRATAMFRYAEEVAHISDEAWTASGNVLTLRQSPSLQEQVMAVFPTIFAAAEDHVLGLLALLITPDSELREAARESDQAVEDKLEENRNVLLHEAELTELLDLASAAVDVIKEQFRGKADQIRKLRSLWGTEEETEEEKPPSTGKSTSTGSSTGSRRTTTGATKKSSTESPGDASPVSQTA